MTAWVCGACSTVYAVGAPRCPHCGMVGYVEQGSEEDMGKITVAGGPSINGPGPEDDIIRVGEAEGGEQSSPGKNSSASETKLSSDSEKSESSDQSLAPTTEPHSSKGRKATSGARSAGGRTTNDGDG